ncbi:MAG: arylsulfatase [Pirellula sp.]
MVSIGLPIAKAESVAGKRPNIILIMTDDQGMGDLACLGNQILKTPNLDRFHKLSTRFTNFHVSPTCSPTRSSMMSGRHEFYNGITHTINERERMALSTTTFPQLLEKAGYQTGVFGKWHLGDEDAYQPYRRGFGHVFIHGAGGIGQAYPGSCADFPPNQKNKYFDCVILENDTIVQTKGFCTDVFFQAALGWTKKQIDNKKPFLTYIAPNAPHGPMIAPEKYTKRFLEMGFDADTAGRYGMIENIDDNFGVLMAKLDEWRAWENTLVVFMTDNGQAVLRGKQNDKQVPLFSAGFKTGKGTPFEGGTHVPAFWRWKGVLGEGVDVHSLVAHIDLFMTFCEIAKAPIPDGIQTIQGRSLVPLLDNPTSSWPDRQLFVHVGRWAVGENPELSKYKTCAIRTARWRFVNNKELYDIQKDPFETTNVIDEHPDVVAELRKSYDAWWEGARPMMVNEKTPLSPEHPQAIRYQKQISERGIPNWVPPSL